jgi:hypothetical protein
MVLIQGSLSGGLFKFGRAWFRGGLSHHKEDFSTGFPACQFENKMPQATLAF